MLLRRLLILLACCVPIQAADLTEEMALVERLRGLKFERPVAQKTITRDELRPYLLKLLEKELPVAIGDYFRVLDALELIENNPKTLDTLLSLYESQVLAFYDPASDLYYSLSEPPVALEISELIMRTVAIHELTHALQDQRFKAGDRLYAMRGNTDAQMAYHAVLEGEAMLVMIGAFVDQLGQGLQQVVENDMLVDTMSSLANLNPGVPADVPPYFVESLKFPYLAGLKFVIAAYRKGGWAAVDDLHRKPPSSTEQLLHPEVYFQSKPASAPASVRAADLKPLLKETMGEFAWRFLLGEKAAEGWGGDVVQVVEGPAGGLMIFVESVWDTEADAREFAAAYAEFLKNKSRHPEITRKNRRVSVVYRVSS